jgi:hypothetical protein
MPARLFVLHQKSDVTAWPITQPLPKIFRPRSWALTLARRRHAS